MYVTRGAGHPFANDNDTCTPVLWPVLFESAQADKAVLNGRMAQLLNAIVHVHHEQKELLYLQWSRAVEHDAKHLCKYVRNLFMSQCEA